MQLVSWNYLFLSIVPQVALNLPSFIYRSAHYLRKQVPSLSLSLSAFYFNSIELTIVWLTGARSTTLLISHTSISSTNLSLTPLALFCSIRTFARECTRRSAPPYSIPVRFQVNTKWLCPRNIAAFIMELRGSWMHRWSSIVLLNILRRPWAMSPLVVPALNWLACYRPTSIYSLRGFILITIQLFSADKCMNWLDFKLQTVNYAFTY